MVKLRHIFYSLSFAHTLTTGVLIIDNIKSSIFQYCYKVTFEVFLQQLIFCINFVDSLISWYDIFNTNILTATTIDIAILEE